MLDPSSSEDSGGEIDEDTEVPKDSPKKPLTSSGQGGKHKRPPADQPQAESPSAGDEQKNEKERLQKEEAERKSKLQIYVFVLRCIAYPFNAKQPTDMARRQQKLNKQQLQAVKDHFLAFLNGETQIVADEAFCNAVRSYYEGFLNSERVSRMVQSGGCSACDFRDVFKKNIERRVRSLPEIDGLSKETVLSSWIAKYDAIYRGDEDLRRQPQRMHLSAVSELILSKEQLYEMFQLILGIKKFEHQLLYNACQAPGSCPDRHAASQCNQTQCNHPRLFPSKPSACPPIPLVYHLTSESTIRDRIGILCQSVNGITFKGGALVPFSERCVDFKPVIDGFD